MWVVVNVEIVPKQQQTESETNVYTPSKDFFFLIHQLDVFSEESDQSSGKKDSQCFVHLSFVILSKRT